MIERLDGPVGHLYRLTGRDDALSVPGATTILAAELREPDRLTNWRRRQDVAAGVRRVLRQAQIEPDMKVLCRYIAAVGDDTLVVDALAEADARQATARDAGSAAHDEIATYLAAIRDGDAHDHDSSPWCLAAARAVDKLDLDTWHTEVAGIRLPHYGGTIDLVGFDSAGGAHIVDWKTTDSGHLVEARYREALQIAAYSGLQLSGLSDEQDEALATAVRGWVARINAAGEACLCEVDVDRLWPEWVQLLERYERAETLPRGWFLRRTWRLG